MDQFSEFPIEPSRIFKKGRMAGIIIPGSSCCLTNLKDVFRHRWLDHDILSPVSYE